MVERTEIEKYVRKMISLDILYKPFSSLGDKGKRIAEKSARSIVDLIQVAEEKGKRIFARVEKKDYQKARTLNEGINEFEKKYPKYGKILRDIIAEKRLKRNRYLIFGLQPGFNLAEEDYVRVMMDLGFDRRAASSIYPHIVAMSEKLGKASESEERSMLLPEKIKKKK